MLSRVKTTLAAALHFTRAEAAFGRFRDGAAPLILGYHRVVEDYGTAAKHAIPPMLISAAMLEKHLDWLGRRYSFVTLDEAATAYDTDPPQGGKPKVAVTFDDGYRDFYEHAFPLLQRKGIPAAVFVVTNLVGTSQLQAHDELYLLLTRVADAGRLTDRIVAQLLTTAEADALHRGRVQSLQSSPFRLTRVLLESLSRTGVRRVIAWLGELAQVPKEARHQLQILDWEALARMQRAGITVGSHTQSHAFLVNEAEYNIVEETACSKSRAEEMLSTPIQHFAYPDGQFNAAVVDAVKAAGYRYGYTTCRHRDALRPQLTVPRRLLWEKSVVDYHGEFSPAVMSCQVRGVFDMRGGCRRIHEP